jgi:hypothetical protein
MKIKKILIEVKILVLKKKRIKIIIIKWLITVELVKVFWVYFFPCIKSIGFNEDYYFCTDNSPYDF